MGKFFYVNTQSIQTLKIEFPDGHYQSLDSDVVEAMKETFCSDLPDDPACQFLTDLSLTHADFSGEEGEHIHGQFIYCLKRRSEKNKLLARICFDACDGINEDKVAELRQLNIADEVLYSKKSKRLIEYKSSILRIQC